MGIEGAIFDMDGTLLDSMHVWRTFGKEYLISKGYFPEKNITDSLAPLTLREAAEYMRLKYGVEDSVSTIENGVNALVENEYFNEIQPKEGVPEMLEAFKRAGIKMCVATVTDRYLAEAALERTNLLGYFKEIFTCGEVGAGKREPKMFEIALSSLGTPKEKTFVFEDSWFAIQTAKAAGFPVAAVYDRFANRHEADIRAMADVYLEKIPQWRDKLPL